jgi:hypothetical protein
MGQFRVIHSRLLVSAGVPINDVSAVVGHEQTSTTLDRYTPPLGGPRDQRVRTVFADFLLTPTPEPAPETEQEPAMRAPDLRARVRKVVRVVMGAGSGRLSPEPPSTSYKDIAGLVVRWPRS